MGSSRTAPAPRAAALRKMAPMFSWSLTPSTITAVPGAVPATTSASASGPAPGQGEDATVDREAGDAVEDVRDRRRTPVRPALERPGRASARPAARSGRSSREITGHPDEHTANAASLRPRRRHGRSPDAGAGPRPRSPQYGATLGSPGSAIWIRASLQTPGRAAETRGAGCGVVDRRSARHLPQAVSTPPPRSQAAQARAFREGWLRWPRRRPGIRLGTRPEPGDDLALRRDEELLEVPLDVTGLTLASGISVKRW